MTAGASGLFYGGGLTQLGKQSLAVVVVAVYAFSASYLIAKMIDRVMGFRVSAAGNDRRELNRQTLSVVDTSRL